jgi:membrane protease YdiL (CAAX protease family)
MYIKQAFNVLHDWWRYIIGTIIVILATVFGQVPYMIAIFYKVYKDGGDFTGLDEKALMGVLEPNLNLFFILLSFAIGLVVLYGVIKFLHKQTFTQLTTTRHKIDWGRILFSFFFWGILSSVLVLFDYYSNPEDYINNFELNRFIILAIIAIILIPFQTSLEEYLFRGYLMHGFAILTTKRNFLLGFIISLIFIPVLIYFNIVNGLSMRGNLLIIAGVMLASYIINQLLIKSKYYESKSYEKLVLVVQRNWVPLLITSSIFGLLHIANPEVEKLGYSIMVYYIGTGLFLGIITLMDDGLELALGFHAANNLFTALLVTANWTAFQTHSVLKDVSEPSLGFIDLVLPVFIIFPILLFIFGKKYKWTNWKGKLFGVIEPTEENEINTISSDT